MRRFLVLGAGLLVAAPAAAQQPAADSARVHVVRPGDTLWDLARQYLGNPFLWPQIYRENRPPVRDPDLIYPNERLRIPGLLGYPTAGAGADAVAAVTPQPPERTVFFQRDQEQAGTVLQPEMQAGTNRSFPVGDFYRAARLVPDSTVAVVGELKEVFSPSVVPMDLEPQIAPYDKVFATLRPGARAEVGDRFALLRPGRIVAPYGRVYAATGEAKVTAVDGDVVTVEVDRMYDRVSVGDLLVPMEAPPAVASEASAPAPLSGRLVALENDSPLPSTEDIGFVDLGRSEGVQEGDELEVLLPPEPESWGTRPTEVIARLKVVRVADATSTVRVLQLTEPALREGLPVRRAASTP